MDMETEVPTDEGLEDVDADDTDLGDGTHPRCTGGMTCHGGLSY